MIPRTFYGSSESFFCILPKHRSSEQYNENWILLSFTTSSAFNYGFNLFIIGIQSPCITLLKIVSALFLIAVSAQLPTATCNANANCTIVNCQIVCTCKEGVIQNAQNQCVPPDPCASQPCKNGGTCKPSTSDPEKHRYVCFRLTALCNTTSLVVYYPNIFPQLVKIIKNCFSTQVN